jgi:hypothetical protein
MRSNPHAHAVTTLEYLRIAYLINVVSFDVKVEFMVRTNSIQAEYLQHSRWSLIHGRISDCEI